MKLTLWGCLVAVCVATSSALAADPPVGSSVPPGRDHDCGTSALCVLLRLEGHPTSLAEMPAPAVEGTGRSMKDLKETAARHGLALSGLRIEPRAGAIDRPSLVFVDRKPHGHYLVVRPVGPSGRLIQVIDPGREPFVVDAIDLFRSPGWTGVALVPGRSASGARLLGVAGAVVLLAWPTLRLVRWALVPGMRIRPAGPTR